MQNAAYEHNNDSPLSRNSMRKSKKKIRPKCIRSVRDHVHKLATTQMTIKFHYLNFSAQESRLLAMSSFCKTFWVLF